LSGARAALIAQYYEPKQVQPIVDALHLFRARVRWQGLYGKEPMLIRLRRRGHLSPTTRQTNEKTISDCSRFA
jgi:hypothetical protein